MGRFARTISGQVCVQTLKPETSSMVGTIMQSCKRAARGEDARCAKVEKISMGKTKRIFVKSAAGKYAVVCGAGVLTRLAREIAKLGKFSSVQVVTSRKAWGAVGKKVLRGLGGARAVRVHRFDDAETAKSLQGVE